MGMYMYQPSATAHIVSNLKPQFGNAILIGITTGSFVALFTVFVASLAQFISSLFRPSQPATDEVQLSTHHNNGDVHRDYKVAKPDIYFREPVYSYPTAGHSSSNPAYSPNSGRPIMVRPRMVPVPPMALARRRTPPGSLVSETIQEEDSE